MLNYRYAIMHGWSAPWSTCNKSRRIPRPTLHISPDFQLYKRRSNSSYLTFIKGTVAQDFMSRFFILLLFLVNLYYSTSCNPTFPDLPKLSSEASWAWGAAAFSIGRAASTSPTLISCFRQPKNYEQMASNFKLNLKNCKIVTLFAEQVDMFNVPKGMYYLVWKQFPR